MLRRTLIPALALAAALTAAYAAPFTQHARSSQGYLGIVPGDLNEQQRAMLHVHGAEVVQMDHDGPAAKAGLRVHDVIVQMSGKVVNGADHLRQMLAGIAPGHMISMVVLRDGRQQTITAQLVDQAELERQAWEHHMTVPEPTNNDLPSGFAMYLSAPVPAPPVPDARSGVVTNVMGASFSGAAVESLSPQLAEFFGVQSGSPLLVRSVEPNSPAAVAGMHAGDVIVRAGATVIATPSDWAHVLYASRGKALAVVVLRDKHEETLTLVPDGKRRSALEPMTPMPRPVVEIVILPALPEMQSL